MHRCTVKYNKKNQRGWGAAIFEVVEDEDGSLWARNDEYASRVNFCPMCGFEAKSKME